MAYTEMEHYEQYKKTGSKRDRGKVIQALSPILFKKHQELAGSLPDTAIKSEILKHAAKALDTYDASKGAKLSTHVYNQIRQASRLNYNNQNLVRMSEDKQQGKFKHYKKALDDLNDELNREPTDFEMAQRLGWPEKEIVDMKDSLFADMHESGLEFADERSQYSDDLTKMNYIQSQLTPEEWQYMQDKTSGMKQKELSDKYNASLNDLNYKNRKLKDKLTTLLGKYDG